MGETGHLRLVDDLPAPPPDPLLGRTLDGRYLIEKVLGEGGMGVVYTARHTTLNKRLAVKVLRAEVSRDQEIVARFRQEAQSATAIGNEHIIDISDFGQLPDGSTYFVMEFLDGSSLTSAMEKQRPNPVPAARTAAIAKQICSALGAAHEAGIVHRDLKPDNIYLVKRSGNSDFVKVLDFGIAKVGGATSKLTKAGQVFGTPHYMSPEQCGGLAVDARTDIYALGVILYEMTSGKVPFDADNLMGILTKHMYEQPIPPRELPPPVDVPPGLDQIIMKCLEKKTEQRYQSMEELRQDLERFEQGITPQAVVDQVERSSAGAFVREPTMRTGLAAGVGEAPAEPPKSKLPLILGLVGVLVVVGGGAGIGAYAMSGGAQPAPIVATPIDAPETPPVAPPVVPPTTPPVVAATPPPPVTPEVVQVTLATTPPGAQARVGDSTLGVTPVTIDRPSGTLVVTFSLDGYRETSVNISSLSRGTINIPLEAERRGGGGSRPRGNPQAQQPPAGGHEPPPPHQDNPRPRPVPQSEVLDPWAN